MKKRLFTALLAAGLLALCGCEMVSVNREKDRAQVVASIGDTQYTKEEVYEAAQKDLTENGYDIDLWDENLDADTRASLDEYLVEFLDAYVEQKLIEMICESDYPLTEEEEQSIQADVDYYEQIVKMMLGYDETNPDAYEGDIDEDIDAYLETMGTSLEGIRQASRETLMYTKVYDAMTEGVEATQEQIQARYDADLQSQTDAYATGGRDGYETAITNDSLGDYILYKPSGYAIVKHILLMYTDEENRQYQAAATAVDDAVEERDTVQAAYDDAKAKVDSAQQAVAQAQTDLEIAQQNNDEAAISDNQAIISANTDIVNTQTAEMNAQAELLVKMEANVDDANADLAALQDRMLKKYQATVDQILADLEAGESFDDLMAQYNDDGGADSGSIAGLGYVVSPQTQTYYEAFESTAFALTQRGQVSDPIATEAGVHILYAVYTADEEVNIPYDIVKDVVKTAEDQTVINDYFEQKLGELKDQYGVETWPKRITFVQ